MIQIQIKRRYQFKDGSLIKLLKENMQNIHSSEIQISLEI